MYSCRDWKRLALAVVVWVVGIAPGWSQTPPKHRTVVLAGKVFPLAEALRRIGAAPGDPDQAQNQMVLLDSQGHIHPLLKDARGRAFWKDARLCRVPVELAVRQYQGSPYVQVIRILLVKQGQRYEVDYWCDVCAISMLELKECECCQGPTRLRLRKVVGPLLPLQAP